MEKEIKNYKEIIKAAILDACDFPEEVEDECMEADISTHYQDSNIGLNWDNKTDMLIMKEWLIVTYGENIKRFNSFLIKST